MGKRTRPSQNYVLNERPLQRVRILRELGRIVPRQNFSYSPREARRTVGQMFGFKPLTPVAPNELSLLKMATRQTVARLADGYSRKVHNELSSQPGEFLRRVKVQEARQKLSDVIEYSPSLLSIQGSRDLDGYRAEVGFDVLKDATELHQKRKRPIRVLDVGSSTAIMAHDLKEKMGVNVEVHALSPENEPHFKAGPYHVLTAEYMPATFREKFDLIVSSRALEYSILPNLALQNIAGSLAPGGMAKLQWRPARARFDFPGQEKERFFTQYKKSKITPAGLGVILQSKEGGGIHRINPAETRKLVERGIEKYGWDALQTIAWCNEVAKLQRNPKYKVVVALYTPCAFGWSPSTILFERKK